MNFRSHFGSSPCNGPQAIPAFPRHGPAMPKMKLRALYEEVLLRHPYLNPYIVKVEGGGDFAIQTFRGLANMYAMIAFAYDDYGSNTSVPYSSYKELS
eukprot:7155239-Heterocapsa_arctica.AAC.1